jgi:hypothetical protein
MRLHRNKIVGTIVTMNLAIGPSVNAVDPTEMDMYGNTGYRFTRRKQQLLNIYIKDVETTALTRGVVFPLQEPLRIDTQSDIYMDSFTTFNPGFANTVANKQAFVMKIPEFHIQANSTDQNHHNAILIPNEDSGGTNTHKVHKGRKMNFISTVNPMTLTAITVTLTDLAGAIAFADENTPTVITGLVVGKTYEITSLGNSDFLTTGASANVVGTIFRATAVGVGTGTATGVAGHTVVIEFVIKAI